MRLSLLGLLILICSAIAIGQSADITPYKKQLREADEMLRRTGKVYAKVDFAQWKASRSDIDADRKLVEEGKSATNFTRGIIERIMSSSGRPSTVDLLNVYDVLMTGSAVLGTLSFDTLRFDRHSQLIRELGATAAASLQMSAAIKRSMARDLVEIERLATTCGQSPPSCTKEISTKSLGPGVLTYECRDPLSSDRITVLLTLGDEIPAEIASPLRQKLRAIPDVEIVYIKNDAAVEVSVLGYENRTVAGTRTGYTVSVLTTSTCKSSIIGAVAANVPSEWDITLMGGHHLLTAATANEIVEQMVASLDNDDLEGERRVRSLLKKISVKQ